MAISSRDKPRNIIKQVIKETNDEVLAKLPSSNSMRQTIQRLRNKNKIKTVEPKDLRDLVVAEQNKKTYKGKLFLLDDSGVEDKERVLLF